MKDLKHLSRQSHMARYSRPEPGWYAHTAAIARAGAFVTWSLLMAAIGAYTVLLVVEAGGCR